MPRSYKHYGKQWERVVPESESEYFPSPKDRVEGKQLPVEMFKDLPPIKKLQSDRSAGYNEAYAQVHKTKASDAEPREYLV